MRWCAAVFVALVVTACGGSGAPAASLEAPTTGDCAGIPRLSRENAPDELSFTRDPVLEAMLPDLIDGMPVQDVASATWIETTCSLGGQASVDASRASALNGVDIDKLTVASGQAVVDGLGATITAVRLPGHGGDELIRVMGIESAALTGSPPRYATDIEDVTVGGKHVKRWQNAADGVVSYLYARGDTLFIVDHVTASQADKIFAALN